MWGVVDIEVDGSMWYGLFLPERKLLMGYAADITLLSAIVVAIHDLWVTLRCITDLANGGSGVHLPAKQSEIIFMGTGTSEGIPRVSCLTNTSKTCPVHHRNLYGWSTLLHCSHD